MFKIVSPLFVFAALCFAGMTASAADEFKPFLTAKIASPDAIANVAKTISDRFGTAEALKVQLELLKLLKGVKLSDPIGLAVQFSEGDFAIIAFLPVTDIAGLSHPLLELHGDFAAFKKGLKKTDDRYTFRSPQAGELTFIQKKDYITVSQSKYAEIAAAADPKRVFTGQEKSLLGVNLYFDNIPAEAVEKGIMYLTTFAAAAGNKQDIDVDALLKIFKELSAQVSSASAEFLLDDKNLDGTLSWSLQAKEKSDTAAKFAKLKGAKTSLGGFVNNFPTAIVSSRSALVFTEKETAEMKKNMETVLTAFLAEIQDNEEELDAELLKSCNKIADSLRKWTAATLELDVVESAFCLDSEGILLFGMSAAKTDELISIAKQVHASLGKFNHGAFDGKAIVKAIDANLKPDYKTAAGASLSSLKITLGDLKFLPLTDAWKKVTLNIFYAIKTDTSVVVGVGLDYDKTEQAVTAVLKGSEKPVAQKEFATFSIKQIVNAVQNIAEKKMLPIDTPPLTDGMKESFATWAKSDDKGNFLLTGEFSDNSFSGKAQFGGQLFDPIAASFKQARDTARKSAEKFQKKGSSGPAPTLDLPPARAVPNTPAPK